MGNKLMVFIDQFKGAALPVSWEALGVARSLAGSLGGGVTALVVGSQAQEIAAQAFLYGADEALYADDPALEDYCAEAYATVIARQAKEQAPEVILFPTTSRGRELAAMVAIDLGSGVLADVTALEVEGGRVVATRPVYSGKVLCKAICATNPQIITLRGRAFVKPLAEAAHVGTPAVKSTAKAISAAIAESDLASKVLETVKAEGMVSLTDASVIVAGGRGLTNNPALTPPAGLDEKQAEIWRAQQGFKLLGELAAVLGGAVGASRAAVDAGYIPYTYQVGQTGKLVSPDLYIACGISGAIQHLAGMRSSKVIVAINKDAEAPIFSLARYGVVGDLYAILPALTEAFKARLEK